MSARDAANQAALQRLYSVQPTWTTVRSAREAVGLADRSLLHAGPPFRDACLPSAPVLSSAVLCCLYEGWAQDEEQAERLIRTGQVRLFSAQTFNVVTPLAAVISPSTQLVGVSDGNQPGACCWSLLGSGSGAQIRFGTRQEAVLERLRWRDQELAPVLSALLRVCPVALLRLAEIGLAGGDDLHSCTQMATSALLEQLHPHLNDAPAVRLMLEQTPLFFLTLWMAACHLMLQQSVGEEPDASGSLVIALAGNGRESGVRLSGAPGHWRLTPAQVPQGPRLAERLTAISPMLGDSGVIDAAGFGAQAWPHADEVEQGMRGWLPDAGTGSPPWLIGSHPVFARFGLGAALDASRIDGASYCPRVAIAMLDADGRLGLLGRGVCQTDPELFLDTAEHSPPINAAGPWAELNRCFEQYERALVSNDVDTLDALFWHSPHTLRYGATEQLYGIAAIRTFRQARPGQGLERCIMSRSLTTFGTDHGVANMVFRRPGETRTGRQTQTWARLGGQWRIVAAHVSWSDA